MEKCPACGEPNRTPGRFCLSCGAQLWNSQNETIDPIALVVCSLKNALSEWKEVRKTGESNILFWRQIAPLLKLTTSYEGRLPSPRAHAHLAIALLALGRHAAAEREATLALTQDPDEFRARQVKVALALIKDKRREVCAGDHASMRPDEDSNLDAEVREIISFFEDFCTTNSNAGDYLNFADFLITLGDALEDTPFTNWRAKLYSVVAYTPTREIQDQERAREAAPLLQRARDRLRALALAPRRRPPHSEQRFRGESPALLGL